MKFLSCAPTVSGGDDFGVIVPSTAATDVEFVSSVCGPDGSALRRFPSRLCHPSHERASTTAISNAASSSLLGVAFIDSSPQYQILSVSPSRTDTSLGSRGERGHS